MSRKRRKGALKVQPSASAAATSSAPPVIVPLDLAANTSPQPTLAPSNVVGTARDYFQMAYAMRQAGRPDLEGYCVEKSIEAERAAQAGVATSVSAHLPGVPVRPGSAYNLAHPLMKGVVTGAMAPRGTRSRLSEAMLHLNAYMGVRDPELASKITMDAIGRICKMPLPAAIIRDRVNRARPYCTPAFDARSPGWRVRLTDRKAPVTRAAQKQIDTLSTLLEHGGFPAIGKTRRVNAHGEPGVWDGEGLEKAHGLAQLVPRLMEALQTYDWAPFRLEPGSNASRCPVAFMRAIDPPSFVQTEPSQYEAKLETSGRPVQFIERIPEAFGSKEFSVVREYTWETGAVVVEHPRTDWLGRGYGLPPAELGINLLSLHALSEDFQRNYLDDNHMPAGLLQIRGAMFEQPEMREMLESMLLLNSGPEALWRVLTLFFTGTNAGDGATFSPLRSASGGTGEITAMLSQSSERRAYICALWGIAPELLGFESHSVKGNSLNGNDPQAQFDNSLDKSFIPPMQLIASKLTEEVIWRFDSDFVMEFVNLDPRNAAAEEELATKLMTRGFTLNQVADLRDEERLYAPILPELYREIEDKLDPDDFDTRDDFEKRLRKKYEKSFRDKVPDETLSPWSAYPDAPVMCNGALQLWTQEQQAIAQAMQQAQGDPSQMMPPGAMDANAMDANTQPPMGLNGQPIDGEDPFGHGAPDGSTQSVSTQAMRTQNANGAEDDEDAAMYRAQMANRLASSNRMAQMAKALTGKKLVLRVPPVVSRPDEKGGEGA